MVVLGASVLIEHPGSENAPIFAGFVTRIFLDGWIEVRDRRGIKFEWPGDWIKEWKQ